MKMISLRSNVSSMRSVYERTKNLFWIKQIFSLVNDVLKNTGLHESCTIFDKVNF